MAMPPMWGPAGTISLTNREFGKPGTPIQTTTRTPQQPTQTGAPMSKGAIVGEARPSTQTAAIKPLIARPLAQPTAAPRPAPQQQQPQGQEYASQSQQSPQMMGGGGGGYNFNFPSMPPQEAAMDPGIMKGLDPQAATLFDFGRPAIANPELGHGDPAMEGLLRLSRRRPAMY